MEEKRLSNLKLEKKKIAIVVPAYNEAKNLSSVIPQIKEVVPFADVLVVDDGSGDVTRTAAFKAGAKVISHPFNMGYGATLQTGFIYAKEKGYDFVVQMDADGQHDPSSIRSLLNELQDSKADVIFGSRFLEKDSKYKASLPRRVGMFIFGTIASLILGRKVSDPTSGFQAMNRKVLEFYASDAYPADFPDADVIIMLHLAGLRMKESPVKMHHNSEGKSMHSGLKPLYYIFKMFLSILVTLMRKWPKEGV